MQKVISKNETVLEFLSPAVNVSLEDQSLRTVLELDNIQENLTEFEYHSNPVFEKMVDKSISAGSIIIVHVSATLCTTRYKPTDNSIHSVTVCEQIY